MGKPPVIASANFILDLREMEKNMELTPHQTTEFLSVVAQRIAEQERIPDFVSLDAVCEVCKFYNAPDEQIAMDLYYYLRNGEENRAMVHQFRERVRAYREELHDVEESLMKEVDLKRRVSKMMQRHITEWKEGDPILFQEYLFDLQALGWRAVYPAPGQVEFERIGTPSPSEAAVLLGGIEANVV